MKLGHEVTLITCDQRFKVDINCDVHYLRAWKPSGFPMIPSLKDLIKGLHSEFDIVHLHYHALFGETVALACKIRDQNLITTIHDEMKRGAHKMLYDGMLLRTLSSLSHRVICLTDGMKRVLVRRGLNEQKVVVIPNAMHVKRLQSQASKLKYGVPSGDSFDLLFVGRLEERKGAQYLLKALLILNEKGFKPTLKIVGEGVYKYKLMSFVKHNGLSSQVVFTGYTSREELLKSYLRARCVVIPSLYEGTPGVAIEALALGKPVITTSIPGMEAITSKRLGFTVPPRDYEALAGAIRKILSIENDELHRIKSKGKEFAEQYDWCRVIKQILLVYQDCYKNVCKRRLRRGVENA